MLELQLKKLIGDAMYMCHGVGEAECKQLIKDKITDKVYDLMVEHMKIIEQSNSDHGMLDVAKKLIEGTLEKMKAKSEARKRKAT